MMENLPALITSISGAVVAIFAVFHQSRKQEKAAAAVSDDCAAQLDIAMQTVGTMALKVAELERLVRELQSD